MKTKFLGRILFGILGMIALAIFLTPGHAIAGAPVFAALTANIPQAWKLRLEAYLNKIPVYLQALTNTHYEGEMKQNGTLNIISIGEITTGTYTGADITFDTLSTTGITFTLDQLKYFGFQVLDFNSYNSMTNLLEGGSKKAAEKMARDIDDYIASLYSNITTNVYGDSTTPIIVGFDAQAQEVLPSVALATLQQKMAESNADQSKVNIVIPVWLGSYLIQEHAQRFTSGGDAASLAAVVSGQKLNLPGIAGYNEIWVSNNVSHTGTVGVDDVKYKIMAGTPDSSITFARALENVETGRLEKNFGGFVKGLSIFGGKIPYENHMALGTFNKGTARTN